MSSSNAHMWVYLGDQLGDEVERRAAKRSVSVSTIIREILSLDLGIEDNTRDRTRTTAPITECPTCWAQVHSVSMTAHEYWHEQLDDTAAIARGMEPGV